MKKIKIIHKIYIILVCLSFSFQNYAQNNLGSTDDAGRVALGVFVYDKLNNMNEDVELALSEKLNEIVTTYATGASGRSRFIVTANVLEKSKNVTNTVPVMYAYNLQFNFYIGDGIEGIKHETTSITAKGVGKSEQRAYLMALESVDVSSDQFKNFVESGKVKIVEYYNSKCDFILKEAQTLAGKNDFDAAIEKLFSIPEVCKDCYVKAMDAVVPIYQKQIDRQCKINLTEATNAWNAAQNSSGADQAASYLGSIDPNAACYKEAQVLSEKISKRVREIDQREWSFKLKEQQDKVDIKKAEIQSARDIGVAYGKNQPKTITTYKIIGWW